MSKRAIYTIWFQEDEDKEAVLLEEESETIRNKRQAIDLAKRLAKRPAYNGCTILVRKIFLDNKGFPKEDCIQWSFNESEAK